MTGEKTNISKLQKAVILVLSVLLLISIAVFAGRIIYIKHHGDDGATAIVPNNYIGENSCCSAEASEVLRNVFHEATDIQIKTVKSSVFSISARADDSVTESTATVELYSGQPSDNKAYKAQNMLPGDVETSYYTVKVTHNGDVFVCFGANVTEQTKALADVLQIKVTHIESQSVIYNGSFARMEGDGYGVTYEADTEKETLAHYKIEVKLPESTGNEYQNALLKADFNWFVKDTGALAPPETGDSFKVIIFAVIMLCSALAIFVLLYTKRVRKEVKNAKP